MGDQRPQAVHQQRLRREALCGLCDDEARRRHDQRHVELSRAARHTGARHAALQRDDGRALHEQRRDRVRGHGGAEGPPAGRRHRALESGRLFPAGKIIQASKNLGVGMAAFEKTSDYVQNYVQGGRILIKHQAVACRLAEMATKLAAVRAMLREASAAVDAKSPDAEALCNMAKLFASEEVFKVCQHAMELHGGNGVMLDFGIEKLLRDAAVFLHMDGTTDISKFKIVKALFPDTAGSRRKRRSRAGTALVRRPRLHRARRRPRHRDHHARHQDEIRLDRSAQPRSPPRELDQLPESVRAGQSRHLPRLRMGTDTPDLRQSQGADRRAASGDGVSGHFRAARFADQRDDRARRQIGRRAVPPGLALRLARDARRLHAARPDPRRAFGHRAGALRSAHERRRPTPRR